MPVKLDNTSLADDAVSAKDAFQRKTRRRDYPTVDLNGTKVTITIEAMPPKDFRALQADHPARKGNDEDRQFNFNSQTFPPALFAVSIKDPVMTENEWSDIWLSPDWSPGELSSLLDMVWNVSNRGLDVNFGASV